MQILYLPDLVRSHEAKEKQGGAVPFLVWLETSGPVLAGTVTPSDWTASKWLAS